MIFRFDGPLSDTRVIVTRAPHQLGGLTSALREAGANVVTLPLLEILPPVDPSALKKAAREIDSYDWIVFTSANAVEALLRETDGDLPPQVSVAVVGSATADRLTVLNGRTPDLEAARSDSSGLASELLQHLGARRRVLLPQAADARPNLERTLTEGGAQTTAVVAYDKGLPDEAAYRAGELFRGIPIGWVTFTSSRIVHHFSELLGKSWGRRKKELLAASIGPVTSATLRELGIEPACEAERPEDRLLAQAIVRCAEERGLVPPAKPKPKVPSRKKTGDDLDWDFLL
jgi:uroporphyrinogen-III synthase